MRVRRPRAIVRSLGVTGIGVAALGCGPPSRDPGPVQYPWQQASLVVANRSNDTRLLRVRSLRDSVRFSCSTGPAPEQTLTREAFAPAEAWVVEAGRALPLSHLGTPCGAFLIDGDALPLTLVYFGLDRYPSEVLPSDDPGGYEDRTIALVAEGATLSLRHPAVHPPPPSTRTVASGCELPPDSGGIAWAGPWPGQPRRLLSVVSSPDGCHELAFEGWPSTYVCSPIPPPFAVGEAIDVSTRAPQDGEVLVLTGQTQTMTLARGSTVAPVEEGSIPGADDDGSCDVAPIACGGLARRIAVVTSDGARLGPGDERTFPDGALLHVVRAETRTLVDTACEPGGAADEVWIESVSIQPSGGS